MYLLALVSQLARGSVLWTRSSRGLDSSSPSSHLAQPATSLTSDPPHLSILASSYYLHSVCYVSIFHKLLLIGVVSIFIFVLQKLTLYL